MTPRSLFLIVLKIIGLLFLKEALFIFPQIISFVFTVTLSTPVGIGATREFNFLGLLMPIVIIICYTCIMFLLLFRTNVIVDTLKLDKGFDQDQFSFNISMTSILMIALIIIGSIILINEIPNLFKNILVYFQEKKLTYGIKPSSSLILASFIKIIFGLLIIGERKRISAFIQTKSDNPTIEN